MPPATRQLCHPHLSWDSLFPDSPRGNSSGWTDPATKQVHMGARFYDPAAGQFLNQDTVATSAQGDLAAGGVLHAYVDDSPVSGMDPSGHELMAATGGGCATAAATTRALAPKPAPKSCSLVCGVLHVYHAAVAKGKAVVATGRKIVAKTVAAVKKAVTVVKHVASVAVAKVSDAYHAAATYAVRAVKAVAATAVKMARTAVHVVVTAASKTATAVVKVAVAVAKTELATVKAAASFVKKHAATIAAIAVGVVVFAGCTALTGGVAVIGCGALAGVAASMVTQGAKCYDGQQGACTAGSFAEAATRALGSKAADAGYDAIRFPSERGPGVNYAILGNFDSLLSPQMITPLP
jgi:large repetitive protein